MIHDTRSTYLGMTARATMALFFLVALSSASHAQQPQVPTSSPSSSPLTDQNPAANQTRPAGTQPTVAQPAGTQPDSDPAAPDAAIAVTPATDAPPAASAPAASSSDAASSSAAPPQQESTSSSPASAAVEPPQVGSASDNPPAEAPEAHVLRDFLHDEGRMWSAPFRPASYDSHTLFRYEIPFALITAGLIASDRYTTKALPNTGGQLRVSNRISTIGSPYTMAGVSAATWLVGLTTKNRHARETGFLALEALAHSQIFAEVIKEVTRRARPITNDTDEAGFWQGGVSFPSGHALAAFSVATVFAREYRDHLAVPIVAYTLASVITFSRVSGRQHYLSDVFVGGAGGFLIGRYVYNEHHDSDLPGSQVPIRQRLRPDIAVNGAGLALQWKF